MVDGRDGTPAEPEREGLAERLEALGDAGESLDHIVASEGLEAAIPDGVTTPPGEASPASGADDTDSLTYSALNALHEQDREVREASREEALAAGRTKAEAARAEIEAKSKEIEEKQDAAESQFVVNMTTAGATVTGTVVGAVAGASDDDADALGGETDLHDVPETPSTREAGLEEGLEALREAEQAEINPGPLFSPGIEEGLTNPIPLPDPAMDPDPVTVEGPEEASTLPEPIPEPSINPDPFMVEGPEGASTLPTPIPGPSMDPDPETFEGPEEVGPIPGLLPQPAMDPDPFSREGVEGVSPEVSKLGEAHFKVEIQEPELEAEFTVEALDEGVLPIPTPEPLDDLAGEDLEPDLDV